jgi:hypothetical protein
MEINDALWKLMYHFVMDKDTLVWYGCGHINTLCTLEH